MPSITIDHLVRVPQHRPAVARLIHDEFWPSCAGAGSACGTSASCEREGSLDRAIRAPQPNDLAALAQRAPGLRLIVHNGSESARLMSITGTLGLPVRRLPSTSPANASQSFERKQAAWREALVAGGVELA